MNKIACVIVTFNRKELLKRCLDEKSLTVLSVNKPKSTLEDIFMKMINSNKGHTTELS